MIDKQQHIKVIAKGLTSTELRLLAATAKLSQKREVVIDLISSDDIAEADVVIVDGMDEQAVKWAKENSSILAKKPVAWVDARSSNKRHGELRRPVLWVSLPIIISRVMDDASVYESAVQAAQKEIAKLSNVNGSSVSGLDAQRASRSHEDNLSSASLMNKTTPLVKILVVDDSPAIRVHLSNLLESDGYQVTPADSGEAALRLVDQSFYDCVFMDVLMPGIDGYAACKKIKSKKIDGNIIPVIMLTGKSSPFDKIRGKMAGCDAYLTKPVDVEKLRTTLKRIVE